MNASNNQINQRHFENIFMRKKNNKCDKKENPHLKSLKYQSLRF